MAETPRPFNQQNNPQNLKSEPDAEVRLTDLLSDLLDGPSSAPPVAARQTGPASRLTPTGQPLSPASVKPIFEDVPLDPELAAQLLAEENAPADQKEVEPTSVRTLGWVFAAAVVIPLILLGLFIWFINNTQTLQSEAQDDLVKASRTIVPTFPPVTLPPTVRSTQNCPKVTPFGPLDSYGCTREVVASSDWTTFFAVADLTLTKDGHPPAGPVVRFEAATARTDDIFQFYTTSLKAKGYNLSRADTAGSTSLGNYRVLDFAKGDQKAQILVMNLNRLDPQGSVKSGENLLRISYNS